MNAEPTSQSPQEQEEKAEQQDSTEVRRPTRIKIGSQRETDSSTATGQPTPQTEAAPSEPPVQERPEVVSSEAVASEAVTSEAVTSEAVTSETVTSETASSEAALSEASPVATDEPAAKYPPPRVDAMSRDLEDEINEALAGISMDQFLGGDDATVGQATELEPDHRCEATVVKIFRDNIFCRLPGQHEGVASTKNMEQVPEVGTSLNVIVTSFNADEGLYELRLPGTAVHVDDWSDLAEGTVVEARVTGHNSGGLECDVSGIRGFMPISQVSLYRVEDLAQFVDEKFQCIVTEANPARGNLVLSHRAVLERDREAAKQQLLESLAPGQVHEGIVRNIRDFGAFVDLGGVDGLIHVSQLSWDRIGHPNQVLEEGQRVKVKIDKIDPETGKIGLSYRDLLQNPWETVQDKFHTGSIVTGTVSKSWISARLCVWKQAWEV